MKPILTITVPPLEGRISVSRLLLLNKVSQRLRRRLKQQGILTCNQEPTLWSTPLYAGDILECYLSLDSLEKEELIPYDYPLEILYEDEHLVVINKPAGLLMHPTAKERYHTVANALMSYYEKSGQKHAFHPVHRLDKDTSGAVIIAKNPIVQHAFDKSLDNIQKSYLAVVTGFFPAPHASICLPIARKEGSIMERTVHPRGQGARTDIDRLNSNQKASYLNITLHTGRTHQIRVHLSHLGHPLLGDDMYGGALDDISRQALHAHHVLFEHPMTKKWHTITAPLPEDIFHLLNKLELL